MAKKPTRARTRPNNWQAAYEFVLRATDRNELFKAVEAAEAAVLTRRDDLARSTDHHGERRALEEALANLRVVKRERLKFGAEE